MLKRRLLEAAGVMLLALLIVQNGFGAVPQTAQAAAEDSLLITEIVPAPSSKGENFEYIELYNPTDGNIDLTGYKIAYYEDMKSPEPWTSTVTEWDIVADDRLTGSKTNMVIPSKTTKIVWLIKQGYAGNVREFNEEYGTALEADRFVYVHLSQGQELIDYEQRYIAVVGPGGDPVADRISMAAYNVPAGVAKCKYEPRPGEQPCDFVRKEGQLAESITYSYPAGGLDSVTKMMAYNIPYSTHQKPTPGSIEPARSKGANADPLLITEVVPAPKTDGEPFEYIELYNRSGYPIDLTGHKIAYYEDPTHENPWTSKAVKWDIVPMDSIVGGITDLSKKTDMIIRPKSTKIVWLIKGNFTGTFADFNKEYGSSLSGNQFVFARVTSGGLANDRQRLISILSPGGDPDQDRISTVAYNLEALGGTCKYVPGPNDAGCDFKRVANQSAQSVNYFYPYGGLDPATRMMEHRDGLSSHQLPTPGKVLPEQVSGEGPDEPAQGKSPADLIITELSPAPKSDGENFEYIELYNTTDRKIDLNGYKINYYENMKAEEPWKSRVIKWDIVPMDDIAGGKTDMTIQPKSTKIVWLIKDRYKGTVQDFNNEYGTSLTADQFVFVHLEAQQGLANDRQRMVAIVRPGGNQVNDRISMAAYNVSAGTGSCKYAPKGKEAGCDFVRRANLSTESVNYFYPDGGLDNATRMMGRWTLDSGHQPPTPGTVLPEQVEPQAGKAAIPGSLLITELVPAPKTEAELFEYVEIYNNSADPIDLTNYKLYFNHELGGGESYGTDAVWRITASDKIVGGKTNMVIQPGETKVIWLLKKEYGEVLTVQDFNDEYGTNLTPDRFVFVKLGDGQGLQNAIKSYVSIVGPSGDFAKDRISTAAYNVEAGEGSCKYVPAKGEAGCDFVRVGDKTQESVIYFYPEGGLDPAAKLMGRGNLTDSTHQKPTPGDLLPDQLSKEHPENKVKDGDHSDEAE